MKIGHTMPELQPFTFHEKFVAHPVVTDQNIEEEEEKCFLFHQTTIEHY